MGLMLVLVLMGAVGVHIQVVDLRNRMVPFRDLLILCVVRLGLCIAAGALQGCGVSSWEGIEAAHWNGRALLHQGLRGTVLVAVILILNYVLSQRSPSDAIGAGDVKLYFVCCLYLNQETTLVFLVVSACVGAVQALYCLVKGQRTFAFAPALIWSWYGALLVQEPYFSQFFYFFSQQLASWV